MEFINEPVNLAAANAKGNATANSPISKKPSEVDTAMDTSIEKNRAYLTIGIAVGCFMLLLVIDLWLVMDDGSKILVPYYLTQTDSQIEEEKMKK